MATDQQLYLHSEKPLLENFVEQTSTHRCVMILSFFLVYTSGPLQLKDHNNLDEFCSMSRNNH